MPRPVDQDHPVFPDQQLAERLAHHFQVGTRAMNQHNWVERMHHIAPDRPYSAARQRLRSTNRAVDKCVAGSTMRACVNSARVSTTPRKQLISLRLSGPPWRETRIRPRGGDFEAESYPSYSRSPSRTRRRPFYNHGRRYLWQVGADHLNRLTTTFSSSFTETGKGR